MALGISFLPNQQAPDQQQVDPSNGVQQALQMISLRLPRITGGAMPPLQSRPPGSPLPPMPGTPEWEELMRRLIGVHPSQQQRTAPVGPTPPPQVVYPAPRTPPPMASGPVPPGWAPPPGFQGAPPLPPGNRTIVPLDRKMY